MWSRWTSGPHRIIGIEHCSVSRFTVGPTYPSPQQRSSTLSVDHPVPAAGLGIITAIILIVQAVISIRLPSGSITTLSYNRLPGAADHRARRTLPNLLSDQRGHYPLNPPFDLARFFGQGDLHGGTRH